ncbi:MAG: repeat- protein-like protein [Acidimicrobiaceae bacterium]|nr:repeat- protein-like protein [Acidimicrobiaceae bacterium]
MDANSQRRPYKYKAFITYSHADLKVAQALQSGLHAFAKPWHQLRAVRVFRDQTNLAANPDLWSSIEAALVDSEYLLIMASPEAARSQWVPREIDAFLQTSSSDNVILILSAGELSWDDAAEDFNWQTTNALPRLTRKVFKELPLYLDLRWARKDEHLSPRNPDFRAAVASLSSTLRGIPLDTLIGQDVLEHKRAMRLAWSAVVGLSVLTVILGVVSVVAVRARARAEEQTRIAIEERNIALSRELAVESRTYLDEALDLANLLALEATHVKDTVAARGALLDAIQHAPQLVTQLHGHSAAVTSVAFSPDGTLASGGRDGDATIRLWSGKTFQPLIEPIHAEKFRVEQVAYSPDGSTIATAGDGGVVRLWDGKTGQPLGRTLTPSHGIERVVFSPNGTLAVSGIWGGLSLWDVGTGHPTQPPFQAHPEEYSSPDGTGGSNGVGGLAFSPNGAVLATGATDGTLRLWNANTLKPLREPMRLAENDVNGVEVLAFGPDGHVLASGARGNIQLWNPETGRPLTPAVSAGTRHVALTYASDGSLISAGDDGFLRVWNGYSLKPLARPIPVHQAYVWDLALSKEGLLASAGDDGSILLWRLDRMSPIASESRLHSGRVEGLTFGPGGILASADSPVIRLSSTTSRELSVPTLDNEEAVSSLAFSASGYLAAGAVGGSVRLWDNVHQTLVAAVKNAHSSITIEGKPMQDNVSAVAFSPDGSTLASAGYIDGSFRLWDGKTLTSLSDKPIKGEVGYIDSMAFSPDGKTLAISGEAATIRLWDVKTQRPLTAPIHAHGTDRAKIVFGFGKDPLGVEKTETIREGDGTTVVAFSPDGRLATGGFDQYIRVWDGKSGAPIGSPIAFQSAVRGLAFSADGMLLACGGWDGTVRLWDAHSLQSIGSLVGHRGGVTRIAFDEDGSTLAAGYEDGSVVRWDVRLSGWQRAAQALANRALSSAERERFLGTTQ